MMKRSTVLILVLAFWMQSAAAPPDLSSRIDTAFEKIWAENKIIPSQPSTDEEFLRRVYLDLTGRIPTGAQAKHFLNSRNPNKRSELIDQLLGSEEHAEYFASQWTTLFLGHDRNRFVDRNEFENWFAGQFSRNVAWNRVAHSLITAEGSLAEHPELNWYASRKLDAADLADDTARLLLGIQLGCARCHNHPHEDWKLEDFYGLAAFYSGLKRDRFSFTEKLKLRREMKDSKEALKEYQEMKARGEEPDLENKMRLKKEFDSGKQGLRENLRLVQDDSRSISAEIQGESRMFQAKLLMQPAPSHSTADKRLELAKWITGSENPYFARAFVNRIWGMLMGRGFVEPVDDLGKLNTPSHPELLDLLAADFVNRGYDVRSLIREIVQSRAYQLSSRTSSDQLPAHYESGKVKMLNADQLLNSALAATSVERTLRKRNPEMYDQKREFISRYFVFLFDNDDSKGKATEFQGTISQALFLLNGKMTNEAVRPLASETMTSILRDSRDPQKRIEDLYLATLSRKPTVPEAGRMLAYVKRHGDTPAEYEDLFWTLLNSHEFLLNH